MSFLKGIKMTQLNFYMFDTWKPKPSTETLLTSVKAAEPSHKLHTVNI